MNVRIAAVLSSMLALVAGCSPPSGPQSAKDQILAADKAFSAASKEDGIEPAFLAVVATDGKLLNDPRSGAAAVRARYMQLPPSAVLTWEPAFVDVAESGELGYTWGRYRLNLPNVRKGGPPIIEMGTYVTVWKRQPDGEWKVALDGGNPDGQK
jgi:ketosteroid isomerase-like protein